MKRVCFHVAVYFLLFRRKDLCEAKHETQSVLKFLDVLFALKSDGPHPQYRHLVAKVVLSWVLLT